MNHSRMLRHRRCVCTGAVHGRRSIYTHAAYIRAQECLLKLSGRRGSWLLCWGTGAPGIKRISSQATFASSSAVFSSPLRRVCCTLANRTPLHTHISPTHAHTFSVGAGKKETGVGAVPSPSGRCAPAKDELERKQKDIPCRSRRSATAELGCLSGDEI